MGCIASKLNCFREEENVWSAGRGIAESCAFYVCNACRTECDVCGIHCSCQTFETHHISDDESSDGQLFTSKR